MTEKLAKVAAAMVRPGKGILAADESTATDQEALRLDRHLPTRRTTGATIARCCSPPRRRMTKCISRASSFSMKRCARRRRTARRWSISSVAPARAGHQGRCRRQALGALAQGKGDRRSRRPARKAQGICRPRRPLRQMAGRHRHRSTGLPTHNSHQGQCPCARPLCRALPGRRPRSHRRARSADGVASHDIDACMRSRNGRCNELFRELYDAGVGLEGTVLKPNMVVSGKMPATGLARGSGREDRPVLKAACPRRCPALPSCPAANRKRMRPPISH